MMGVFWCKLFFNEDMFEVFVIIVVEDFSLLAIGICFLFYCFWYFIIEVRLFVFGGKFVF